jgi:hypothetical protein
LKNLSKNNSCPCGWNCWTGFTEIKAYGHEDLVKN